MDSDEKPKIPKPIQVVYIGDPEFYRIDVDPDLGGVYKYIKKNSNAEPEKKIKE